MDVNTVRAGLASVLSTLDLHAYAYWPDNPAVPCVVIAPATIEYGELFGAGVTATFNVTVVAGFVAEEQAQSVVDGWVSDTASTSVAGLLLAASASTVGGSIESVRLASYGPILFGDVRYLGAQFDVTVIA